MEYKELLVKWDFNKNPKAPKFPVLQCFCENSLYYSFDLINKLDYFLDDPHGLQNQPDTSQRIIDSKGDIYKLSYINNEFCAPIKCDRLSLRLLKQIGAELEEINEFIAHQQLEEFIAKNNIT